MKLKKNYIYFGIASLIVLLAVLYYSKPLLNMFQKHEEKLPPQDEIEWMVDMQGYLYYPLDRGEVSFRRENLSETETLLINKIIYQSRNGNIYGLLVLPKITSNLLPGVVLLPGAGVGKESELGLALNIAELGIAVLTVDQRGVGETKGSIPSIQEDLIVFSQGQEPYNHLVIYDALRAYDLLKRAPFIDPENIIMAGESLGGMRAIIAAAIDRNIKGALIISSAGFDYNGTEDKMKNAFGKSIDPDHYIRLITPRKIVMMHNYYDRNVPLINAVRTYQKAQQPKQFVLVNDTVCNHGYCESMHNGLVEALSYLIDSPLKVTEADKTS